MERLEKARTFAETIIVNNSYLKDGIVELITAMSLYSVEQKREYTDINFVVETMESHKYFEMYSLFENLPKSSDAYLAFKIFQCNNQSNGEKVYNLAKCLVNVSKKSIL